MKNDSKEKIYEWIEEENFPSSNEEQPRKSYAKKIVAWIDILGMRKRIKDEKNNDAETIIGIMASLNSYVVSACKKYLRREDQNYMQIADGFMIVADLKFANDVCSILADVQWKVLINMKMLARGAITVGNVSVVNDMSLIIGPAYVDAYAMESENAIYSRIILSEEFFGATKNTFTFKYVEADSDKITYIDYIKFVLDTYKMDVNQVNKMLIENGVVKELQNQHDENKNPSLSVRQKHGWTLALLERNSVI